MATLLSHNLVSSVPTNATIRLEFDSLLAPASVGMQSVMLTARGELSILRGKYRYSEQGGHGVIEIVPEYVLEAGSRYTLTVTRKLLAADQTPLAMQELEFSTIGADPDAALITSTAIAAPRFELVYSSPRRGAYNLITDPAVAPVCSQIVLEFSEPVDPSQWPEAPAGWDALPLSINFERIDGDPRMPVLTPQPASVTVAAATVTITLSTASTTVYNTFFDPARPKADSTAVTTLSPNTLITLQLDPKLRSLHGAELGEIEPVVVATELFPKYGTVRGLFWRWRHVTSVLDLEERDLDYLIFEESRWLATMLSTRFPEFRPDQPKQIHFEYVRYKILWNILSEAFTAQVMQGTIQDKQLGQFRVTKNFDGTPKVVQDMMDNFEKQWRSLLSALLPVTTFTSAIRGISSPYVRKMDPNAQAARRMDGKHTSWAQSPWAHLAPSYHLVGNIYDQRCNF